MKMINILFSLFIFLMLSFYSLHFSFGVVYFSDNFSSTLEKWEFVPGSVSNIDSWKIRDGGLVGLVGYNGSSYLYPKISSDLINDFVLETNIMSLSGIDTNIIFRESNDNQSHYLVGFRSNDSRWSQDNNNIVLYKYENGYTLIDKYPSINFPRSFNLSQNVWHKIKLVVFGRSIKVYYDGILAIDKFDSGNLLFGRKIALQNWGGNFGLVTNMFDNFKISDKETTQNKIVFLTGMGGSWNEKAMVFNQDVPQSEWKMTPFVKNYDSMFLGFESNGLVKNKDYFVYNYDWRKPIENQILDFDKYIGKLGLNSGDQIDLVGHSLGGIIARSWTQQNPDRVGKVITLASPNTGAVKVYDIWNGAKVANFTDPGSLALSVLLALQRKNNQMILETVHSYIPVLKDILPTFDYLSKKGKLITPPQNDFLIKQNANVNIISSKLSTIGGKGTQTAEWINLVDRNLFDISLGLWEQGRPSSYRQTEGDGTVLQKSANFSGYKNSTVLASHGDVPNKSVNLVLAELGLGTTIANVVNMSFNGAVFYIGSPAFMKVNCGNGDINEIDGFVLIPNQDILNCVVKLTGNNNGAYHLVMGNSSDDESWKYSEGTILNGENKIITIKTVDYWYEQLLREINNLLINYPTDKDLNNMKIAVLAKDRNKTLNSYWLFRKKKLETMVTWRMISYLEKIIDLEFSNQSTVITNKQRKLALSAKALADKTSTFKARRKIFPNMWQSLNYFQAEELLRNSNYSTNLLAEKIFAMVWH